MSALIHHVYIGCLMVKAPHRGRGERRLVLIWLFLLLSLHPAAAQSPRIRTSLSAPPNLYTNQRVTLVVELLAPGFFSGAASFDLPDPSGLLLIPPAERPVIGTEQIDGESYTSQRYEIAVFVRRPGAQTIPPFAVRFHYKRNPLDKDALSGSVKTEPIHLDAKLPPGSEKLAGVISARNLSIVEAWNRNPEKAKVGDAFTRTITFSAPDVPAMAFSPFPSGKIDGLGLYPKPPLILDRSERGETHGERRDVIVYVCQRPGAFLIPAVRMTWWDLDSSTLRTIDLPARKLEVAPNPAMIALSSPLAADRPQRNAAFFGGLFAALFAHALAFAAWITRARWLPWLDPLRPVHLAPLNPASFYRPPL